MSKKKEKAIVKWEDQMSKDAKVAADMEEGVGGGQFFSCKGGNLSWMDNPIKDNVMGVIILDSVLENVFYEGKYDPENVQTPTCFAFGRDAKEMRPNKVVIEDGDPQNAQCGMNGKEGCCPNNEFGTADTGKGKACSNARRLAMIPAGTFGKDGGFEAFTDPEDFKKAAVGYLKLNVMSVKGYAAFVTQIANTLKRPPYGIVSKVTVVPDDKSIFRVLFEAMEKVEDGLMPTIFARHEEVKALIEFPYQLADGEDEKEKKPARKKPYKKAPRNRKY